jgi:hypothetical protein
VCPPEALEVRDVVGHEDPASRGSQTW